MSMPNEQQEQIRLVIQIGARASDGRYPLEVAAWRGATGRVPVGSVRDLLALPERLLAQARGLLEPEGRLPADDEDALGLLLARLILPTPARQLLAQTAHLAGEQETAMQVQLLIGPPELATLPWEWLTLAGRQRWSPALLEDYGLTRLAPRTRPLPPPAPRGGVLVVVPAPGDSTLRAIQAAVGDLPIEVLVAPSNRALAAAVRRLRPQVLHLLARADFETTDRPLLLLDRPLAPQDLAALAGSDTALVLIDGYWQDDGALAGAAGRMAYQSVQQGVAAAVAFHSSLYPAESGLFAAALYGALAEGVPLHQAVARGRNALAEGGAGAAWGLPLLVLPQSPAGSVRRAVPRIWSLERFLSFWPLKRPLPPQVRELAVPVAAGGIGLLLAGALLMGQTSPPQTAVSAGADVGTTVTPAAIFQIGLPTPTFAPPVATPALGENGVTVDAEILIPPSGPAPFVAAPAPLATVNHWETYLVQAGDTLVSIATKMGSDPQALAALNRLGPNDPLLPGRGLMVPVLRAGAAAGAGALDVSRGRQDLPLVSLTIDTEINDVLLYQILDILRPRGIHATFFVTGRWVRAYPDAARAIVAGGHEIGNHSLTHPAFTKIGLDGVPNELDSTERIVVDTLGITTRPFFRFPYGDKNPAVLGVLAADGYISYHWSADDGSITNWLAGVAANPHTGYGGILLMHQRPNSISALPGWLDQLDRLGFKVVPLSQILK